MFKWIKSNAINTAIEKISDGVIAKMNINEERRNREFTYQLKELEFYKSNYEKDLKEIFDYWFELVRVTQIKDNDNLTVQEKQKYQRKYADLISTDKISQFQMKTLKYGGKETSRILALQKKLLQENHYSDKPNETAIFIFSVILSALKKEILGQDLDPIDVIQVMVNDFDDNEDKIKLAKEYIVKLYKKVYGEEPFWS
ncbi:MAG: hypothetical protein IJD91_08685 [Clostridia bacterium]|nr:hypothetical protein [Clostridia bacterium]